MKIALPLYRYPANGAQTPYWREALAAEPVGLIVANPASGPGEQTDPNYVQVIREARSRGKTVLGYVHTLYGGRAPGEVQDDILAYGRLGYHVDGIFLDELPSLPDCAGLTAYYRDLATAARQAGATRVAGNPGADTCESYLQFLDVLVLFEGSPGVYASWDTPSWTWRYPAERFWHLVHSTPAAGMAHAVQLASARNAGHVLVTDDHLQPDPWNEMPTFWDLFVNHVSAARPSVLPVTSTAEVLAAIERFSAGGDPRRIHTFLRSTLYWVAGGDGFAPAKLAAWSEMSLEHYERALRERPSGFRGRRARSILSGVVGTSFEFDAGLSERLVAWGEERLGTGAFHGAHTAGWRFMRLPS